MTSAKQPREITFISLDEAKQISSGQFDLSSPTFVLRFGQNLQRELLLWRSDLSRSSLDGAERDRLSQVRRFVAPIIASGRGIRAQAGGKQELLSMCAALKWLDEAQELNRAISSTLMVLPLIPDDPPNNAGDYIGKHYKGLVAQLCRIPSPPTTLDGILAQVVIGVDTNLSSIVDAISRAKNLSGGREAVKQFRVALKTRQEELTRWLKNWAWFAVRTQMFEGRKAALPPDDARQTTLRGWLEVLLSKSAKGSIPDDTDQASDMEDEFSGEEPAQEAYDEREEEVVSRDDIAEEEYQPKRPIPGDLARVGGFPMGGGGRPGLFPGCRRPPTYRSHGAIPPWHSRTRVLRTVSDASDGLNRGARLQAYGSCATPYFHILGTGCCLGS
jgi:hypothetical protein